MNNIDRFNTFSLFVASILGSVTMVGCAGSSGAAATDDPASLTLNTASMPLIAGGTSLKLERAAGAHDFAVKDAQGWKEVDSGIWEHEEDGIKQQLAVDAQGTRTLIARVQKELDALYAKRDAGDSSVEGKIASAVRTRRR